MESGTLLSVKLSFADDAKHPGVLFDGSVETYVQNLEGYSQKLLTLCVGSTSKQCLWRNSMVVKS